jgi:chromosomal replication initiator protein
LSHDVIGLAFGGRDHTTAMRSVKNVERRLRSDPSLAADVRDVLAALDHSPRRSRPA